MDQIRQGWHDVNCELGCQCSRHTKRWQILLGIDT